MNEKKYRVLFIASDNSKSSGAFLSMTQLAKVLKRDFNCDVHVLIQRKGNGTELLRENNIPFHYVRAYNWIVSVNCKNTLTDRVKKTLKELLNLIAITKGDAIIRKYGVDIIHINTSWTYIGALMAHNTKVPYIWHIREFLEEDQNDQIWDKSFGYRLMGNADRIIAISKSIYEKYEKILPAEKLKLIYNGIDAEKYYVKRENLFSNKIIRLLITGTINESKGQWQIIQAMKKLVDQNVFDFILDIVGDGKEEYVSLLKQYVNDNGLDNYVTFWGFKQNTAEYYKKADITCVCSKAEAFGRVTVEAMLSGNLVIGAAAGATIELISHKETGLLYDHSDIESFVRQLLWIRENKKAAVEIANNGQKYALQNMTADMNARNIYHIYEDIL